MLPEWGVSTKGMVFKAVRSIAGGVAVVALVVACGSSKTEPQAATTPTATVASVAPQPPPPIDNSVTPSPAPSSSTSMDPCMRAHVKGVPCEQELGWRSQESIEYGIASVRSKMRACYNDALRTQPNLTVVLRFTLVIATNGTVKSIIDAGSTRSDPQVAACVQSVLRAMVFDGAANETTVTIPLKFAPPTP